MQVQETVGTQEFIQSLISGVINFLTGTISNWLLPLMIVLFGTAIVLRVLVHYTVTRELWFAKEYYKRAHQYLDSKEHGVTGLSFYVAMKLIMEKTYYELFVVRAYMKRRNPDYVMDFTDRLFLIQEGCARLVKESLRQTKHLRYNKERPRFIEMTKNVFDNNPNFKKVMGIIPVQATHDILSILPGIFIIGGIFGTFLGIMAALPELANMELTDPDGAKEIMDNFLRSITFSMSTSIIGIILSVSMTFLNTVFDPEKAFMKTVNRFENAMELLWDACDNNTLPKDIPDFNEHRDPIEALAEDAIEAELNRKNVLKDKDNEGLQSKLSSMFKKNEGAQAPAVEPQVPAHAQHVEQEVIEDEVVIEDQADVPPAHQHDQQSATAHVQPSMAELKAAEQQNNGQQQQVENGREDDEQDKKAS